MPRKPLYNSSPERREARRSSKMAWYHENREQELAKMRKKYDEKVAIPLDRRRRHQGPQAAPEKFVDSRLVQRCIRRMRRIDSILRGQSHDDNLKAYAREIVEEYRSKEHEDGCMALMDIETGLTLNLKDVEDGLATIRVEVGIRDVLWQEGAAIRDRVARILTYVEDIRQWAEKRKLVKVLQDRRLLFQQSTD